MKIQKTKGGFTLIELLVVITIIGILATWATATYTSQIQKARDTTRISDLSAFKSAIEQIFQDASEYPEGVDKKASTAALDCDWADTTTEEDNFSIACLMKLDYIANLPKDPKSWQWWNKSPLDYLYAVWPVSSVKRQAYEISSWFENTWNITWKAWKDSWSDNNRYEIWTWISKINTAVTATDTSAATLVNITTNSTETAWFKVTKTSCWSLGTPTKSTESQQSMPIVIKWDCAN